MTKHIKKNITINSHWDARGGGNINGLRRFPILAIGGHISQLGEVCVLVSKASRLSRLQQTNVLNPLLYVLPHTSLQGGGESKTSLLNWLSRSKYNSLSNHVKASLLPPWLSGGSYTRTSNQVWLPY